MNDDKNEIKEKSQFIEKLKILNQVKDSVISEIRTIQTRAITKTQGQNLREYAAQTESIEEVLLYIDYQCVRNLKNEKVNDPLKKKEHKIFNDSLQSATNDLKKFIVYYKNKYPQNKEVVLNIVKYAMGIFARNVMIKSKQRGE